MLSEHMGTTLQAYDSRLIKMREGCVVAWARMIHEGTGVFIDDVEASTLLQGLSPLKDKALFDLTIGFRGYELHGNIEALFAETVREHGIVAGLGKDDELRMGHYTIAIDKAALKAIAGTLVIRRSKDERPR